MSNLFLNIPVPAMNGVGAPVDVSAMGKTKSLVCGGGFEATVNVEFSTDAGALVWAPLATFQQSGNLTIDVAARWMRAVTLNYKGGAPNLDVGSDDSGTTFALLPAAGTSVDISALALFKTVVAPSKVIVEVSEDGVSWAQIFSLPTGGDESREVAGQFARVVGGVDVTIAAAEDGGADEIFVRDEGVLLGSFPTMNFVGPGVVATDAGGGVARVSIPGFVPGRTLFVAKSWPADADPTIHYTVIQNAINYAASQLVPVPEPGFMDQYNVLVFAGIYNEDLVLGSNVNVIGMVTPINSSVVVNSLTYLPGQGINAPQINSGEFVNLVSVYNLGTTTFDSTAKAAFPLTSAYFFATASVLQAITTVGRPGAAEDGFFLFNSNHFSGAASFTDMSAGRSNGRSGVELVGCRLRDIDTAGETTLRVQGGQTVSPNNAPAVWSVGGTSQVNAQGVNLQNDVVVTSAVVQSGVGVSFAIAGNIVTMTAAAGTLFSSRVTGNPVTIAGATTNVGNNGTFIAEFVSPTQIRYTNAAGGGGADAGFTWSLVFPGFTANGCKLFGKLTVDGAQAQADIRSSNYTSQGQLVSLNGGSINRTNWNAAIPATLTGANPIVFSVPYPLGETSYNVLTQLTLAGASSGLGCTVTNKTETGFTLNDPSVGGGNEFDYTVTQE